MRLTFFEGDVMPTMSTAMLDDGAGEVALYNLRASTAQRVWNLAALVVKVFGIVVRAMYLLRRRHEVCYEHNSLRTDTIAVPFATMQPIVPGCWTRRPTS